MSIEIAMSKRTYSIEEVAQILGLSRNSAYVAARGNLLPVPTIRIGRRMVVSKAALDQLLGAEAA
jgi:excisionase family DNA binding protein